MRELTADVEEQKLTEQLLDAAIDASRRTRRVMLIAQVFGVLAMVVATTTLATDWLTVRRRVAEDAKVVFRCLGDASEKNGIHFYPQALSIPEDKESNFRDLEAFADKVVSACRTKEEFGALEPGSKAEIRWRRAAAFLARRHGDERSINSFLAIMEGLERDYGYAVPISVLGIRVDINDAGYLGGLALLVILVWLELSVRREKELRARFAHLRKALAAYQAHNFFGSISGEIQQQEHLFSLWFVVPLIVLVVLAAFGVHTQSSEDPIWVTVVVCVGLAALHLLSYAAVKPTQAAGLGSPRAKIQTYLAVALPAWAFIWLALLDISQAPALRTSYGDTVVHVTYFEAVVAGAAYFFSSYILSSLSEPVK